MRHPEFRLGLKESVGANIGVGSWGVIMGVAMVQAGLPIPAAILMSLLCYSGGAQLAALPLIVTQSPLWLVLLTAACVNLRFVIFSAQWRPYIIHLPRARRLLWAYFGTDVPYVVFMRRFKEQRPGPGQLEFFLGAALPSWLAWQGMTIVGITLSNVIPAHWGLGFAAILSLMGLMFALIGDITAALVAVIAGATAIIAFGMPFKLYTVVAIVVGVAAGLLLEKRILGMRPAVRHSPDAVAKSVAKPSEEGLP